MKFEEILREEISSIQECVSNPEPCSIDEHVKVIMAAVSEVVSEVIGKRKMSYEQVHDKGTNEGFWREDGANELRREQRAKALSLGLEVKHE